MPAEPLLPYLCREEEAKKPPQRGGGGDRQPHGRAEFDFRSANYPGMHRPLLMQMLFICPNKFPLRAVRVKSLDLCNRRLCSARKGLLYARKEGTDISCIVLGGPE